MAIRRVPFLLTAFFLVSCHYAPVTPPSEPVSHYERFENKDRVIVFVHGIFGNATDTWTCTTANVYWPKLIRNDRAFSDSDVYVVAYSSPFFGNRMTIDEVVASLDNRLQNDKVFSHREVVFVAHSLGGLIVQRFLLTHRDYAKQVPFIYFFSTPETGSQVAQLGHIFNRDPLLEAMFPGDQNAYLLNLENEWTAAHFDIKRFCAYEKQPMHGVLVVDRLSGTRNCSNQTPIPINEDHAGIVKPCSAQSDSYIALRTAVINNPIAPKPVVTKEETVTREWRSPQLQVGCNQTNSGTVTATVQVDPRYERVLSATVRFEDAQRIQGQAVSIESPTGPSVTVRYGFNGLDRTVTGCPGGGQATVVATFTIVRKVPVS
jgi:hypothetical protein